MDRLALLCYYTPLVGSDEFRNERLGATTSGSGEARPLSMGAGKSAAQQIFLDELGSPVVPKFKTEISAGDFHIRSSP